MYDHDRHLRGLRVYYCQMNKVTGGGIDIADCPGVTTLGVKVSNGKDCELTAVNSRRSLWLAV